MEINSRNKVKFIMDVNYGIRVKFIIKVIYKMKKKVYNLKMRVRPGLNRYLLSWQESPLPLSYWPYTANRTRIGTNRLEDEWTYQLSYGRFFLQINITFYWIIYLLLYLPIFNGSYLLFVSCNIISFTTFTFFYASANKINGNF